MLTERTRKLIGAIIAVALILLVLMPFLPITAQTTTTLPSSSSSSGVVESKNWTILPRLANGLTIANASGVYITLNNTQSIATPAPFDQFINITEQQLEQALGTTAGSALWSQAEAGHFLNTLFLLNGQPLYAWVQNYSSNWVALWVKLPNGIPAKGNVSISMEVTGSNQYPYTGVYPAVYQGYDNGKDVFTQYGYFNDTMPSGWTAVDWHGSFTPTPTTSGLELLDNTTYSGTYIYASLPNAGNYTVIMSWWYNGRADGLVQELYGELSALENITSITSYGGATPYAKYGTAVQNEFYMSEANIVDSTSSYDTASFSGQGTHYVTTYFGVQANTQYYGYTTGTSPFQLNLPKSFSTFILTTARTNSTVFISAGDGGYTSYVYVDTVIVIPTPPNNVMPSVKAVSAVPGQYIAWGYKPLGNTLNITVQVKNYTAGPGTYPGLVLYSTNMGNYTSDNMTSGFSALTVSFTGAVAYHAPYSKTYVFLNTSAFTEPTQPFNFTVTLVKDAFGGTTVYKVYINKTGYMLNITTPLQWGQIGFVGLRADPASSFASTDPVVTASNTTLGVEATTTTTTATTTLTSTVTATATVTSTITTTVGTATTVTVTVTRTLLTASVFPNAVYAFIVVTVILIAVSAGLTASRSTAHSDKRKYVKGA